MCGGTIAQARSRIRGFSNVSWRHLKGSQMTGALVVEDDAFARSLIAAVVKGLGFETVHDASSVAEAMRIAHEVNPEVAVIDLDLGDGPTGVDLAHGLRRLNSEIAIVMLTSYSDPRQIGQQRALPAGVPYVVKSAASTAEEISAAIDQAREQIPKTHPMEPSGILSAGQWETLRLIAAGYSNPEIARRRRMTDDAVNKSITRLVRQLGLSPTPSENVRVMLAREYFLLTGSVSQRRG